MRGGSIVARMRGVFWMVLLLAGCPGRTLPPEGSNGEDGSAGAGFTTCEPDFASLVALVDNPTGTLSSAADAQGVAEAFGELLVPSGPGGQRRHGISCDSPLPTGAIQCTCSGGGPFTYTPDETKTEIRYSYDACCLENTCCYDGCGWAVLSDTAAYSVCLSFHVTSSCLGPWQDEFSYCQDKGAPWYLVAYQGETYAVSGSYDSATGGFWAVRDANADWACMQDPTGAGSCTDGTQTYDWS